jgi:predicted MFS family arabinose efflux permease
MKKIANIYKQAYSGLSSATWWLSFVMLVNRMGTMVLPFMTLYLTESKHYSVGKAGLVVSIFGIGSICGGFIGGKLTDKFGFYYLQLSALLGGGTLFIALGQMTSLTSICVTTFFLSLVNESFRPANAAAIAHYSKEENRTRSYSLNRLAINLGWAAGGEL